MKRLLLIACVLVFSSINNGANASSQAQLSGLNYLSTAQNVDGSWSGDIASDFYSTAAVLETLKIYNNGGTSYQSGFQWCQAYPVWNVDYLARKIILLSQNNLDYSDALTTLFSLRNTENSGWGLKSYTNDIFDTAFALESLSSAKYSDATILYQALSYLTLSQNPDGGWGSMSGGPSSAYVTAWVLKALIAYNSVFLLHDPINKASAYLLTKQNVDGGFGSSPSNVYETALSVMSLIESGKGGAETIQSGIQYLTTTQASDGSWSQDPYYTALALQALAAARPNLMVSSISLSNPMPQENVETTITATIKNAGYEDASNIVVRFYFGDPSSGGVQIGSDQIIPTLIINSSTQVSATASFTGTGGKTIFVVSDPDNTISETSEADNKSSTRIWVATAPDLAVFSEDLKPSTYVPAPGTAFTLAYTVRNLGESAADAFAVSLYDGDPTAGGTLLQSANISGLVGTETRAGTFGVTFTGDGPHTLYLAADSDNHITELSETNNTGTVTIQVGGVQQYADLVAGNITIAPDRPHANDLVTITASVRNEGLEDASSFTVELFDGAPESGGTLIHSQIVSLSSGTNQTISANWTILSGIHDIYLIADRSNQINETNETNNQTSVKVMTDMVDITVSATDLTFTPAHPVNGDTVVLNITVHNQGIKDTGPFNLALYDGDPASGGALLQTFTISNIAADGSTTLPYTFTAIPWTYRFYAIADTENTVTELYEDNNTAIRSLKIKAPGEILGPDLVPVKIDLSSMTTDPRTLVITGTAAVTFQNKGDDKITTSFDLLVFEDTNLDGTYTPGLDNDLGTGSNTISLWPEGAGMVNVTLSGNVKFLHAPLYAFVDSNDAIHEQSETNNHLNSCKDCEKRPVNPIEPVVKWKKGMQLLKPSVISPLDTNGDGKITEEDIPAIIATEYRGFNYARNEMWNGRLRAVRGSDGGDMLSIDDTNHKIYPYGAPVGAGDIDGDGLTEILVAMDCYTTGKQCSIAAYEHDGTLKWDNLTAVNAWRTAHPNCCYSTGPISGSVPPIIADLEHDGTPEIISGRTVMNSTDGSIRWSLDNGWGDICNSTIADLDLDGRPEVVSGGRVYSADGVLKWTVGLGINAIGRFSDDPYPEIVLIRSVSNEPNVYLLDHNGNTKWGPVNLKNFDPGGPSNGTGIIHQPIIADFDGDGEPEIGVRRTSNFYALDKNGNLKQTYALPVATPDGSIGTVFDLNGDNRPEVLIFANESFRIFDGPSGELLYQEAIASGGMFGTEQNVMVADVDLDGHAEIVVISREGVRVYKSRNEPWVNSRKIWNQYDYHVTNVNDDGTIPQYESPSWLLNNTFHVQATISETTNPYLTPNLTASYLRSQPNGASLDITVRIGNGGSKEASPGASVMFYSGSSSGTLLGSVYTTQTLQPGKYEDITFGIGSGYAGISTITAIVDQANTVSECLEDDNQVSLSLSSGSGMPDLRIGSEDITLSSGPYYEGSLVTITANIANAGFYPATNISLGLYDGNPASGGTQIGATHFISSIDAAGSASIPLIFYTMGTPGTHVLYIVVDNENIVAETNETNNSASITIDIQEPVLPNPSITANDIALPSSSLKEGDRLTVSGTILNRGAAASNILVKISVGSAEFGVGSESKSEIQTIYPALGLGQSATVQATFETVGLSGNQTVLVEIDPDNAISESVETDNTASAAVSIQSAGLATSLSTDTTQYSANTDVQISYTISNNNGTAWNGTGIVNIEDTSGNLLATAATFSIQDLKPVGLSKWSYRIPATVTAARDMKDTLSSATVDFGSVLTDLGIPSAIVDKNSIRVLEFDSAGNLVGEKQAKAEFVSGTQARVLWFIDGLSASGQPRYFNIYFDTDDHGPKPTSTNTRLPETKSLIAYASNYGAIYIVESNGDGTFGTPVYVDDLSGGRDNSEGIVLDDFNNDGFPDIIVGSGYTDRIYYYQNKADGLNTFFPKVEVGVASSSGLVRDMAAADFNNDEKKDFVVSGYSANLYLFMNNGDGTFTRSVIPAPGGTGHFYGKTAADVDGDGNMDIAVGTERSYMPGVVYVYRGKGDGTFLTPALIGYNGGYSDGLAAGDFNEDGKIDIIETNDTRGNSNMYPGNGDGTFGALVLVGSLSIPWGWIPTFDAGDFNNDGHLDVIAANDCLKTVTFHAGNGNGSFKAPVTVGTASQCISAISVPPAKPQAWPVLGAAERVPLAHVSASWNTVTTPAGEYKVHATIMEGQGMISESYAPFTILPDTRADAKVVTDKISYNPNETATITSTITSNSANYVMENLTAKMTIEGAGSQGSGAGSAVYSETKTIKTLMQGAAYSFKSYWSTVTHPAGTYPITLEVKDATGAAIAATTASIIIQSTTQTGTGITGTITAAPSPVYQGREETFTCTITNSGNEDLASLTATVLIVDPETGEIKTEVRSQETGVRRGETITATQKVSTMSLAPKTYLAILQIQTPAMAQPKTISSATFEVKPGIEAAKKMPDVTNLLVWINEKCERNGSSATENTEDTEKNKTGSESAQIHAKGKGQDSEEEDKDETDKKDCIRIDLIDEALRKAVTDYRLVYDKKDFQAELRNPYYTDFLILGDHQHLEDHYNEELREQVYSGKGLILSPYHHEQIEKELIGMKVDGHLPGADYPVSLTGSELGLQGTFQTYGRTAKVKDTEATNVLAWITVAAGKEPEQHPAVIKRQYGQGKALYLAFDLAMSSKDTVSFPALLEHAVEYVHRPASNPEGTPRSADPNRLVPIEITIKSLGGAFDIRVTETYPEEIRQYDPEFTDRLPAGTWTRDLRLDPDQTKTILYYALTPDKAGTYTLATEVGYMENGEYAPYQTLSIDLIVDKDIPTATQETISAMTALPVSRNDAEKIAEAIKHTEKAQKRVIAEQEDMQKNIHDLLKAADALLSVTSADTAEVRLMLDNIILFWEAEWYYYPSPPGQ